MTTLNKLATLAILSSVKTSCIFCTPQTSEYVLIDVKSEEEYGKLTYPLIAELLKEKSIVEVYEDAFVHASNKKISKHLKKKLIKPEGMSEFPTNDMVILTAAANGNKVRDALLSRLANSTDIHVDDGGFFFDGEDYHSNEWYAVPYAIATNPNSLYWAVCSNTIPELKGYAYLMGTQEEAFFKIKYILRQESARQASKAA